MCGNDKPCILVVDDTTSSRDGLALVLREYDYCTEEAATALEAIDFLDSRCAGGKDCPDLILLDIDLPDVKGGTLAGWIRAVYPRIPIIFLTAYGRLPAFEKIGKELGIPLELKPVEEGVLMPLISRTLRDYETRRSVGTPVVVPPLLRERLESVRQHRCATEGGTP